VLIASAAIITRKPEAATQEPIHQLVSPGWAGRYADDFALELFEQQTHGWILFGAFVQLSARLLCFVNHLGSLHH
jgi:hypothetical protein